MTAIPFDTHKFVQTLEEAGFNRRKAEGLLSAQRQITSDLLESQLATRADTTAIKADMVTIERKLDALKIGLSTEQKALKAELDLIKWIVSGIGFGVLLLVVKSLLP